MSVIPFRIGHGYDIHRFEEHSTRQSIILGGITIPYERGLVAHSDGDVVIHAICDALLGAAALGDIGQHFPDTSVEYKNCDSRELLRQVVKKIHIQQYVVGNIDVSIIAEMPKLAPYISLMRATLAQDLQISNNELNIKATTHEGLDAIGEKRGIGVHAVALIIRELK